MNRREWLGAMLAIAATAPVTAQARGPMHAVSRELARELAHAYALDGDRPEFNRLFDLQSAFRGLNAFPPTPQVVSDAVSALRRVLHGEDLDRDGFRRVVRLGPGQPVVVFSDHHVLPAANRQSGVWRNNREPFVRVLRWYAEADYTVVENGDVEDSVILEPDQTIQVYESLLAQRRTRLFRPYALLEWFREDPLALRAALVDARRPFRQRQLDAICAEAENASYYEAIRALAAAGRLVRLAGNHDTELQHLVVREEHLVPRDVAIIGRSQPIAILHGHQFDSATNPAVGPFYGEVISECLGVFYQGPDRTWSRWQVDRILSGGFPNRLSTHPVYATSTAASLLQAVLTQRTVDDEEWAQAWETLFGHPIAWEYGAHNWASSVRSSVSRPAGLMDDAMAGRQFFKYRHLDEWQVVQALQTWDVNVSLVLGHSHEPRSQTNGPDIGNYYNSGAVGRYFDLIWALEILPGQDPRVVGWNRRSDGRMERWAFEVRDSDLFSYFEPLRTEVIA